jgi:hypothetical protein
MPNIFLAPFEALNDDVPAPPVCGPPVARLARQRRKDAAQTIGVDERTDVPPRSRRNVIEEARYRKPVYSSIPDLTYSDSVPSRSTGENHDADEGRLQFLEWKIAWLREYRCHVHYLTLLAAEEVTDRQLSLAWLAWWNASNACRDVSCRLGNSQSA